MIVYENITYRWRCPEHCDLDKLKSVLKEWYGTPYREGQCSRGKGVDCLRFAMHIACQMANIPMIEIPRNAPFTSMFLPEKAFETVKIIRKQLPMYKSIPLEPLTYVYPGDIIVSRNGKAPGHLQVVGPEPNRIYHADRGVGVVFVGMRDIKEVVQIWRLR